MTDCSKCGARIKDEDPYLTYPSTLQIWCVKCTVKHYMGTYMGEWEYGKSSFKHANR